MQHTRTGGEKLHGCWRLNYHARCAKGWGRVGRLLTRVYAIE